jgi:hypothetical protein
MTQIKDQTDEEARRAYLVETFGPDVLVGLATDPAGRNTTAAKLAAEPMAAARRRQQQDDLALVQVAAAEQDEDEALDLALRITRRGGGRTPPGTMAKAGRALRRRGYTQGSTAERLARMAGQGQGWRAS